MDIDLLALPDDIAALKEIVRGAMSRADAAEADSAAARAAQSDTAAYCGGSGFLDRCLSGIVRLTTAAGIRSDLV